MRYISKKDIVIPKRNTGSHKGDNGRVLVIGGSRDYVGAVALAGLAALRSGADLVTIAAPEKVGWVINALSSDLIVKKFKGDDFCASRAKDILKLEKGFNAVLIGNGYSDPVNS
jgi:NAD(P)H-hydrate repair Nnr-like enzyme with NAD(P)H-hydrate dehydratase domain